MLWGKNDSIIFEVYVKKNQKLKHLNKSSAHTAACYKAITSGIIKRLAKLTTVTNNNRDVLIHVLYLDHASALQVAKLSPENYPKLGDALEQGRNTNKEKKSKS